MKSNIRRWLYLSLLSAAVLLIQLAHPAVLRGDQNNSLLKRAHREQAIQQGRGSLGQSGPGGPMAAQLASRQDMGGAQHGERISSLEASWITVDIPQPKDFRVHDLVEIIVNEVSKHSTKADSKLERENSIDASLTDWLRFGNNLSIRPDRQSDGDPKIAASIEREFEGTGEQLREDAVTYRIMAEVVDVLPNGTLVLEATKTIVTDEDATTLTLTGVCRSTDIGLNNTLLSSKLAKLQVRKTSAGAARDATRRGAIHRFWDRFNPF